MVVLSESKKPPPRRRLDSQLGVFVQRLWRLEPHMCDALLDALVASEFLEKTHHEAYVLAGGVIR